MSDQPIKKETKRERRLRLQAAIAKEDDADKPAQPKRKTGRPTKRSKAVADEICNRLSVGETLSSICRDEHLPARRTVIDWWGDDEEFSAQIARARDAGYDYISEDCMEIADNATNDFMERQEGEGAEAYALNGEHIQRSKLRIETRLKLLAKWSPKKYGEKTSLEHTGPSGGPIELTITKKVV